MTPTNTASISSIPSHLEPEVLRLREEGLASPEISAWLLAQHGVKTSHASVLRLLHRKAREKGLEALKGQLTEQLSNDLVAFDDTLATMRSLGERAIVALDADKRGLIPSVVQTHRMYLDNARMLATKFRFSGLDRVLSKGAGAEPSNPSVTGSYGGNEPKQPIP